jgi:hypothetical protein
MTDSTRSDTFHTDHFSFGGEGQPYIQVVGEPQALGPLFAKLVSVNSAITKLKHTGKFAAGNTKYSYATEADVIEPIAQALATAGLATIPSVVEQYWHDLPGKYGTNRVCTVHAQMVIGDSETGAYVVAHTYSTAANGDKASNAAFTTAIKYLLAKLALVAFGDDADEYTIDGEKAVGTTTKKGRQPSASKAELDALTTRIKETNSSDAVKAYLAENNLTWSRLTASELRSVTELVDKIERENQTVF